MNGEIIAVETGTGLPLEITIPPQSAGDTIIVTVTKQNYYRYSKAVSVQSPGSIDENNGSIIESFVLYQNFPNPYNPITTINYEIPERSIILLKVYDVLGNELITLVNEEKTSGNRLNQ